MNIETTVKAKVVIPTKSRIAAWWMLIAGGVAAAICLAILIMGWLTGDMSFDDSGRSSIFVFGPIGITIFIFYFVPGLLVLKGGRWGWIIASAILSLAAAWSFSLLISEHYFNLYSPIPLISLLILLILILSDHVSCKRGGDKNEDCMS
jgi:putative effector of murein hydrolase LrgA (UPF0299 family)